MAGRHTEPLIRAAWIHRGAFYLGVETIELSRSFGIDKNLTATYYLPQNW